MAIGSSNIMRLIGYTSVSHFGFIVLGIFVMNSQGLSGANLYMFNHGLSTAALFLIAGFMISRARLGARSTTSAASRRSRRCWPALFLVAGLSALSLPGLSPFVSRVPRARRRSFTRRGPPSFAVIGIVLAALYILWLYQRTMTGPGARGRGRDDRPERARDRASVAPLLRR